MPKWGENGGEGWIEEGCGVVCVWTCVIFSVNLGLSSVSALCRETESVSSPVK